jgi:hypothetical protein
MIMVHRWRGMGFPPCFIWRISDRWPPATAIGSWKQSLLCGTYPDCDETGRAATAARMLPADLFGIELDQLDMATGHAPWIGLQCRALRL